jgi:hypothetical protein
MSVVTKFLNFDFKASLEKVANLLTLNTDPTRITVNVISSVCECGIWSFIVGLYNNDQQTIAMIKQFKKNLSDSCIKYKETPVIGIYNFATNFTQSTLATYFTFLACNCIKLISYVQISTSPSCAKTDILLILHTNDICKAYRLFKSTDLTNPAALCTNNKKNSTKGIIQNQNPNPTINKNQITNPTINKNQITNPTANPTPTPTPTPITTSTDVNQVISVAFSNFLNGLAGFMNIDENK